MDVSQANVITPVVPFCAPPGPDRLQQRLSSLGLNLAMIGPEGNLTIQGAIGPLEQLLLESPAFVVAVRQRFGDLRDSPGRAVAIWPGLWLIPLQAKKRLIGQAGLSVTILASRQFPESEQFQLLCQQRDLQATRGRIDVEGLPDESQIPRLAAVVEQMRHDLIEFDARSVELSSLSVALAKSYEELSLLYKLSCSMVVNRPSADFLGEACSELQQVVSMRWMALQLTDEMAHFDDCCGGTFVVGQADADLQTIRRIGRKLLNRRPPIFQTLVVENPDQLEIDSLRDLASNLLVVPLQFEGQLVGILFGGDKLDSAHITSMEAKLCSSLANGLAVALHNVILYEDMQSMFMGTLRALTRSIDVKDSYTLGHSERVAMLSRQIAQAAQLDDHLVERAYLSGLVHDVGKIGVPEAVLTKPDLLRPDEFALVKQHPDIGARILGDIRPMRELVPGVLYHHERWDGQGYPGSLAGEEIPMLGRVIALADAFDAMSSNRTYRPAMPHHEAVQQVRSGSGSQFDPDLAEVFLTIDFESYFQILKNHQLQPDRRCA